MKLVPIDLDLGITEPDDIYQRGSITFIYSPNNEFYSIEYPYTHINLAKNNNMDFDLEDSIQIHRKLRSEGYLLGRTGKFEDGTNVTMFYPMLGKEKKVSEEKAKIAMSALMEKHPEFDYNNMYVICMGNVQDTSYKMEVNSNKGLTPTDDVLVNEPDDIYENGSITFIYTPERKLLADFYPVMHYELIKKHDLPGNHFSLRRKNYIMGRMASLYPYENDTTAIVFYDISGKVVPPRKAKTVTDALLKKFPDFNQKKIHVVCESASETRRYNMEGSKNTSDKPEEEQDPPGCDRIGVPVNGQEMSIKQILANLHMVRGDQLEKIKHGFCPQSTYLSKLTSDNCPQHKKLIDYINRTLKCGQDDYQSILKQGKQGYRQQLKGVFGNPDAMDSEFRTQKDMDKAWDFYRKAESVMGFEQWMRLRENI